MKTTKQLFEEIYNLCAEQMDTGNYDSLLMEISSLANDGKDIANKALHKHGVMDLLPELKEGEAESLARCSTYAFGAAEKDINPINWGDAEMFFLEGYNYARRILKGNKP